MARQVSEPAGNIRPARPGEAWRAPTLKGLVVEASTPSAVEAYVGGVSRGLLSDPQTSLSKFGA